jgi:hypothetical protein
MGRQEKPMHIEHAHDQQVQPSSQPTMAEYAPAEIQKETRILEDPEWFTRQKRYLRKLDFILMPTISILYFFEYLDRGNIAVGPTPV